MPKYRILLHGKNLYADMNGKIEKVGFYTTRIVEAETSANAQIRALQLLEKDGKVKDLVSNCPEQPPILSIEEFEELEDNEIEFERTGFVFYVDDNS